MLTDNLRDQKIQQLLDRVRALETRSPLRSSSITEGRLRVGGSAVLLIDSDGGLIIQGSLDGDGNITWTGVAEFTGSFKSTGPAVFDGDVDITKTLDVTAAAQFLSTLAVKGAATLQADLTVNSPGRIMVGTAMKLVPSVDGGSVEFADGSRLSSNGGTTGIRAGGSRAEISSALAQLSISGRGLTINSGGYQMTSMPTTTVAANPGSFIGALVIDAAGNLRRVAS